MEKEIEVKVTLSRTKEYRKQYETANAARIKKRKAERYRETHTLREGWRDTTMTEALQTISESHEIDANNIKILDGIEISSNRRCRPILYVVSNTGCWLCVSHKRCIAGGYPMCRIKGKRMPISRAVAASILKENIDGLMVRHKCDTPLCINPDHLETGTAKDNMHDAVSRGRFPVGERCHLAKLTEEQALTILKDKTTPLKALAAKYNIHPGQVSNIRNGKSWKHLNRNQNAA